MELMKLYKYFSKEYKIAAQSYYTWKLINNTVSKDSKIYNSLNENSTTWNIILHSLQSTYFIALRRIFDNDKNTFSAERLLNSCIENISEFGKDKIAERKIDANAEKPEWLDKYLESVYQIERKDIQKLLDELLKQKEKYIKIFKPIINKVFAHSEIKYLENSKSLFVDAKIEDIEEILNFLFQIDMILFDLLHNGKFQQIGTYHCKEEEYLLKDIIQLLNKISA
ncbi:MAG: hypothetical protein WC879_02950 [Melioribacteraceae bacterium]